MSGGQSCALVACSVCHHMLAADEPSCSLLTACLTVCCLPLGVRRAAVCIQCVIAMLAVCFTPVMLPSRRYCRLLVKLVALRIAFRIARRVTACLLFVAALLAASLAPCQLIVHQSVLPAIRVSMCRHSAQHWKRTANLHGVLHCAVLVAGIWNARWGARCPVCG